MIPVLIAAQWMAKMAATDGVITQSERELLKDFADSFEIDSARLLRMAYAVAKGVEIPEVEQLDRAEAIGDAFERFVVTLCSDKSRFTLLAWRSDKYHNGIYAEENLLPDLQLRHRLDRGEVEYYVECKYRSTLQDGILDLSAQLPRYRRMTTVNGNSEIFLAIGIGGTPSNPEQFYLIPSRMVVRDCIINITNFSKCQIQPTQEAWHNYINHFYEKRVFNK